MHRLFAEYPEALARTREIVERCRFDLAELQYQYPEEAIEPGLDPQQSLVQVHMGGVLLPAAIRKACLTRFASRCAMSLS